MILDKLNVLYFLISFSIGLICCYATSPRPEIVMKFPSPSNAGKVTYKDKSGQCYVYKAEKVSCAMQKNNVVKPQPIMEDFRNKSKQKKHRI
jgi:hypothetical protein